MNRRVFANARISGPRISGRRLVLGGGVGALVLRSAAGKAYDRPADSRSLPLVMLDPGHGGKDPGAIGVSGTYEKHVAFAVAGAVREQLRAAGFCRVEMTRARDVFVPLDGRVDRAQARAATLFVSIHADALTDPDVRGASVYTLAEQASDAQTAALAARENSADRFGGPQFQDTSPAVAAILASLVRRETRIGSARLCRSMLRALPDEGPMLANPGRHAAFVVLKAADIPSVLVEMGFMSNAADEAALCQPVHQARVAAAIAGAVRVYLGAAGRETAALD